MIDDFLDGAVPDVYRLHWSLAARQSDAYAPQLRAPAKTGQLCLAHQLRELTRAAELEPDAAWWATELRHVFGRGMRLHAERAQISAESFQRRKVRIINAAECLIKGPPLGKGMARRLQQRYQRLWSELFVFLERDGVEPTNNASERDLRNSVIHRKVAWRVSVGVGQPDLGDLDQRAADRAQTRPESLRRDPHALGALATGRCIRHVSSYVVLGYRARDHSRDTPWRGARDHEVWWLPQA
ncbi:MAG: transposase [Chloroflexota bacterium]